MTASSYQLSAISHQLHTDCFFIFALSLCLLIFEFSPSPGLPRLRLAMTDKKAGNDTLQGNPKLKALNPKQIPISKFKAQNRFSHLDFGHLILFRISDLGFRIWSSRDCRATLAMTGKKGLAMTVEKGSQRPGKTGLAMTINKRAAMTERLPGYLL